MKKIGYIIILLFLGNTVFSQRISTGFTLGLTVFQDVKFDDNFIFPQNSYFIYYTGNDEKDDLPEYRNWVSGASTGININVDYKRWMLTLEPKGTFQSIKIPVLYPTPLGNLLDGNWSTFKVAKTSWALPALVSFKLTSKANGPFIIGGLQYEFNFYSEKNKELDSNVSDGISVFISDKEMYGVLYNENNYYSYIVGVGLKVKDKYSSIRMVKRFGGDLNLYPEADYVQIEWVLSRTLNFQKLRKGHVIYTD